MTAQAFGLPDRGNYDEQRFTNQMGVTNVQWSTWRKPRGVSMLYILCIGGGGGGGGGFTGADVTNRDGGGGGGSSAVTRVLVPATMLPDLMYIQVGGGGQGVGSGGGTAGSGILSYVAMAPNITASNVLAVSGAAGAVGGTTGTAAVGTGGAAGTIAVIGSMPLAGYGHFAFIAGQAGASAQNLTDGNPVAIPTTSVITMGGSGGGSGVSADSAGGGVTLTPLAYLSEQAPQPVTVATPSGGGSSQVMKPFWSFGGTGGGCQHASTGFQGGNGSYGGGGGGGGAGTTGGRGGNGGSGIIIIRSW